MGKLYSLMISVILMAFNVAYSMPKGYEWWLDNDVSSIHKEVLSGANANFQIDTSGLPYGLHSFNCRLYSEEGVRGSIYQKLFYIVEEIDSSLTYEYEYWTDNDYAGKTSGDVTAGSQNFDVDLPELSAGFHYFNYRLNRGGEWGSVYSKMLYVAPDTYGVEGYEYWLDDDYSHKSEGKLTEGGYDFLMDLRELEYGLHRFCYRLKREDGVWGSVFSKYFFIAFPELSRFHKFEYWLDDDYANRKEKMAEGNPETWDIDLSGFDINGAKHWFNLRVLDENGEWGAPYRKCINTQIEKPGKGILGYRHYFNDENLGYVEVERQSGNSYEFEVDVPESAYPGIRNVVPTFEGEKVSVSVSDSINYAIQIQTESGWTHPAGWKFEASNSFSTTAVDMAINSKHTFDTPKAEEFAAIRFTATADSLYFKTDMPISLDIYKDGEKHSKISGEELNSMTSLLLEEGEYYGLLYGHEDIADEKFTLQIMDAYKTATPYGEFDPETRLLTIMCNTEGATILYTFDLESEWQLYEAPIAINRNGVVYVKATCPDIDESEVGEISISVLPDSVATPAITFEDGMVTISCTTKDAEIHYTLDGTNPTEGGTLYASPFQVSHNCVVKAIAHVPGLEIDASQVASLVIDSYTTAAPYGEFNPESRLLTLRCPTEGASIFYTFDLNGDWLAYSAPIEIEGNGVVYAKASCTDFNDSEITEIVISDIKCAGVTFKYDGRYLHIESQEEGADIRYSSDGSEPSGGNVYSGKFDVKGLCTVRALSVKEGYMDSDVHEFQVDRYADENHAETSAGGLLKSAFEWNDNAMSEESDSFKVTGVLNEADYSFLNSNAALRHLDLEKVKDAEIPDRAFLSSRLISISLPEDLAEYGDSIFTGAQLLSSIIWNSKTQAIDSRLTDGLANPNVLLYVPSVSTVAAEGDFNIVANGNASSITLHYGYPYYAEREFHAANVSMTKEFLQSTEIGVCQGWETLVLPFQPEEITHAINGSAVPFAKWDGNIEGAKPFWLYSSSEDGDGWNESYEIEVGVPYIISMPNNPNYVSSANLEGEVTFSASKVYFKSDYNLLQSTPWIDNSEFEGTFMPVDEEGILSLNVNDSESGMAPGSAFVPDGYTPPFGAYVRRLEGPKAMPLFGNGSGVYMPSVTEDGLSIETPAPGMLKISSGRERKVAVTTATGVTIRTIHLKAGESVTLEGLTRDLYIVGGVKVMVR